MATSMKVSDVRKIIEDTLQSLGIWSADAEEIMVATCANESNMGAYRVQVNGPARGIFQMEPEDFNDIWTNWLKYHGDLAAKILPLNEGKAGSAADLINNDPYAAAMCRVHYLRAPGHLPAANDLDGIWTYYKHFYNTLQGAATRDSFIMKYNKFVLGK